MEATITLTFGNAQDLETFMTLNTLGEYVLHEPEHTITIIGATMYQDLSGARKAIKIIYG